MSKEKRLAAYEEFGKMLACGRSVEEEIQTIEKYGNHGNINIIRSTMLATLDVPKPKATAENCVIFGCYRPFSTPFFIRDSIQLMEKTGIDYTYLDQEYCCGIPMLMTAQADQIEYVEKAGDEFNRKNMTLAGQKGAKKLAYVCIGCVYAARNSFKEIPDQHIYILDLILDKLENQKLSIAPTVMGYFEGCHCFVETAFPESSINWKRYRQFLDKIEGLTIVDLPNNMCCKNAPGKIVKTAEDMKLDKLILPCSGCYRPIAQTAKNRLQIVTVPELLLTCINNKNQ